MNHHLNLYQNQKLSKQWGRAPLIAKLVKIVIMSPMSVFRSSRNILLSRLLIFVFFLTLWCMPVEAAVTLTREGDRYVLENNFIRLSVNPVKGGVIDSYLVKGAGQQLIPQEGFMLGDHFWQQNWPGEFLNAPYEVRIVKQTAEAVTLEVSCISKGWDGSIMQKDIKVIRRMTLNDDSPALLIEVSLQNVGAIGRTAGYWNQNILFANGNKQEKQLYFRPAIRGISEASYEIVPARAVVNGEIVSSQDFVRDPQQGWMAVLGADSHNGIAFVMEYDELLFLYNCFNFFTSEWQYKKVGIPGAKTWKTSFVIYPLVGLPRVDYAGRHFVAAVEPGDADGKLTVHLHLAAAGRTMENVTVSGDMLLVRQPNRPSTPFAPQQVAGIGLSPTGLTFHLPHDPSEPLALRFTVKAKVGGSNVEEKFETWYGAKYGRNWQVDLSPLYPIPAPRRQVTFLKPDKIEKMHNNVPHVLVCKGLYASEYLPDVVFNAIKADVTFSYFKPTGLWPAELSYFPTSYEELMALDIIALVNVDADALGGAGQEMVKDFVTHGGTLVYGGDLCAYGNGNLKDSILADLLPVTFPDRDKDNRVRFLKDQLVQVCAGGKPMRHLSPNGVMVYGGNAFTLKDGAQVLLTCKDSPVLVKWKVGQGCVIAITGTVLGDAPTGKALFTRTPEWGDYIADLLKRIIIQEQQ